MTNDNLSSLYAQLLRKNKLNGTNFLDWERNLRIILRSEGREDALATPIPMVTETSSDEEKTNTIQLKNEALPARIERYVTHKAILDSKFLKGKHVSPHVISLTRLFKSMENLGTPYDQELATDIVLRSLHDGFAPFRMQYHMNGLKHDLNELHKLLKNAEGNMIDDKRKEVPNVNNGRGFKKVAKKRNNNQGKDKQFFIPNGGGKLRVASDHDCFFCKAKGH
ncbi:uncharacterized protein LOC124930144 [Impatiens glandulifera]|uniref:uncharacterized protein LOC124930144 n=1 Tax=Impatiens glandulifera TaxID=253017 RepID=UPI001FB0876E|nr:uncharacterized protein LOC124930144 [Impatiens glandulifera]